MHSDVRPPRSVLLALWLRALAEHPVKGGVDRAVDAVCGDDEPHTVVTAAEEPLGSLADLLHDAPVSKVVALLPVPGDASGAPSHVSALAVEAGECVLATTTTGAVALVPEVTAFGSDLEPGHLVTWRAHETGPWWDRVQAATGSLADADRTLRSALTTATRALTSLDVARWREDAADEIAALRSAELSPRVVPRGLDARVLRVLTQSIRLRAIVRLGLADDGGAVNLWQADQRLAALRDVDGAARRALSAATLAARD